MNLNDIYEITIIDDNHNGMGIAKVNNIPIFVEKAITNDIVKIKITKISKKYLVGQIIEFIYKEKRNKIDCPYYNECGGCDLLHIDYAKEIELKKKYIERLFKRKIKIESLDRINYRNKITLHIKNNKLGLYKENSNEIIPIEKCLLVDKQINEIIKKLNDLDLDNITEIIIKKGTNGILIVTDDKLSNNDLKELIKDKNIVSIYQDNLLIYGEKYIKEKIGNIEYVCNNGSFFQVNNKCCEKLYNKVKTYIEKGSKVLDLYCGSGTIGIYCSDIAKEVIGLEINKDSVKCCKENLKINNITNYKIINKDAKEIIDDFDIVIVDPPRSGLSKQVIKNLIKMNTKKIIYISCNPNTLKRDIELLTNYDIKEINAFNMFPGTKHVESVVILERK